MTPPKQFTPMYAAAKDKSVPVEVKEWSISHLFTKTERPSIKKDLSVIDESVTHLIHVLNFFF